MQTIQSTSFGTLLRRHRLAAGLTQAELAERTHISVRSVSDMERGVSRWPHRDTVALLAESLRLAPEERAAFEMAARRPRIHYGVRAPGDVGALHPQWRPPHLPNVPIPLTPLLGREREEAALAHLLRQDDVRLVTLTGPPGVGKTRLAIRVAAPVAQDYMNSVVFVPLADVRAPEMVLPTVAQALGVREMGHEPLVDMLALALGQRTILLLLDNVEQVLAAVRALADLLARCSGMKLLVTSRAALRIRGEHEFPVMPLPVPDPARPHTPDALARYAAVALFAQRARAVRPNFALTPAQAPAVAAICARLDGLPLAIELAAARSNLFTPSALLARLERRLPLLSDGARDLPERQRTLEDAIAWSYDLLDAREQWLFRQLAVFRGGWTLEAAEAVCALDDGTPSGGILRELASLVDKSLVVREESADGQMRFRMLETLREYGLSRLSACGEEASAQERHFACYLALAEAAFAHLRDAEQLLWLQRLERDHDNARAALRWALDHDEAERGLRLAWGLYLFWRRRGHLREGQRWLEALLALPSEETSLAVKARALFALAALRLWQLDLDGLAQMENSLALFRQAGDTVMVADTLHALGMAAYELGDEARGLALLEDNLALSQASGDRWSIAQSLWTLGEIAYARGDYERAAHLNAESLALFREVGDVSYIAIVTLREGYLARARGDEAQAAACYHEALALARSLDEIHGSAEALEAIAMLLGEQGMLERATGVLSAATHLRQVTAEPPRPSLQPAVERVTARLRAALGDEAFAAAWNMGRALSLDEVIAAVMET